jgi:hypothetical protein
MCLLIEHLPDFLNIYQLTGKIVVVVVLVLVAAAVVVVVVVIATAAESSGRLLRTVVRQLWSAKSM